MSIVKLLAGRASEAVDMNAVKVFLQGQGVNKRALRKQTSKFAASAKRSDIGGKGVSFDQMSRTDQRKFIMQSQGTAARSMQKFERNYSGPRGGGEGATSLDPSKINPSTSELLGTVRSGLGDAAKGAVSGLSSFAGHVNDRMGGEFARSAIDSIEDVMLDSVLGTANAIGRGIKGGYNVTGSAMSGAAEGVSVLAQGSSQAIGTVFGGGANIAKHIGETVGPAVSGMPHAIKEGGKDFLDFIGPVTRGLGGSTSGRGAANASAQFQQNYRNVFSSEATAEAFGVDQNILKQAFSQEGDEFATTLKDGGLGEEAIKGLEAFRSEVRKVGDEGGNLSSEGMQAMLKNQAEADNMYAGFSRAGATASPNALLRGMAGEGTGMESIMGIAAVAGLAGGANVMMGGEFTEGAAVGGIGALSVKGIAKGVAGSMGDIENAMMKSILGDDMASAGTSTVLGKAGTQLSDLSRHARNQPLNAAQPYKPVTSTIDQYLNNPNAFNAKARGAERLQDDLMGPMTGSQARRQNLEAIQDLGDDAEQLQGFGKKQMRKLLNPNKEKNVAMNNRALVLGGGMLSGVAFTGTADRRDYRRGFNAHRGNRI